MFLPCREGKKEAEIRKKMCQERRVATMIKHITVFNKKPGNTSLHYRLCRTALSPSGLWYYLAESSSKSEPEKLWFWWQPDILGGRITGRLSPAEHNALQRHTRGDSPKDTWVPDHSRPWKSTWYSNGSQCSWCSTGCICAICGILVRTCATTF